MLQERLVALGPEALVKTFADVLNAISKDAATAALSSFTRTCPTTSTCKLINRRCDSLFGSSTRVDDRAAAGRASSIREPIDPGVNFSCFVLWGTTQASAPLKPGARPAPQLSDRSVSWKVPIAVGERSSAG